MKVFISRTSAIEKDYIINKVANFINKTKICHSYIVLHDEEGDEKSEVKVDFSWFLDENDPVLFISENLENFDKTNLIEENSEENIEVEAKSLPIIKISEGLLGEIEKIASDNTWKRKAWAELSSYPELDFTELPYTILIWYQYKEDPEKDEIKEGEMYLQVKLIKENETINIKGYIDSGEINYVDLI